MDLALNNLQRLICHKTQINKHIYVCVCVCLIYVLIYKYVCVFKLERDISCLSILSLIRSRLRMSR